MNTGEIVERALEQLADTDELVWDAFDLAEYVGAGANEIVRVKPDANTQRATVTLDAGISQTLPDDGLVLVDVVASLGLAGLHENAAITEVKREVLDRAVPGWTRHTPARAIIHYMYERRDPLRYDVYPPQPRVAGQAVILYGARVAATRGFDGEIALDSIYTETLLDYVLYRAHSKAVDAADRNAAAAHRNAFYQSLGAQQDAESGHKTGGAHR